MIWASSVAAHEFWIEPLQFVVPEGTAVKADLRVGQNFRGSTYPYLSHRFQSFEMVDSLGRHAVSGTEGNRPALTSEPAPGLVVFAYHAQPETLEYRDPELFAKYVTYEGLDWAIGAHQDAGLPLTGFSEHYTRNAKALLQIGPHDGGADRPMGLPFELVVEGSPYAPGTTRVTAQLLWQGQPVADWPVNVFTREGETDLEQYRTDPNGRITVPFPKDSDILMNAVWLQRTETGLKPAWESWWASTTFGRVGRGQP